MPRRLVAATLIAVLLAIMAALVTERIAGGVSLDLLYVLRDRAYGPRPVSPPIDSALPDPPVVMVAIDEETYRRAPFADTPQALWLPMLGKVIDAIDNAGPAVIGVDLIYPTTVESALRGYERDYLLALRKAGRAGHLVLTEAQHQTQPILPYRSAILAVGGLANIRSANLDEDSDGVLRRVPLFLDTVGGDGKPVLQPAFAAELAARALKVPVSADADGAVRLGGRTIAGSVKRGMVVNHPTTADAFPQYSLADLQACAEAGKGDFFTHAFKGKVVIIGTALDVEDRKLSSNRWVTKPEGQNLADRCVYPPMRDLFQSGFAREAVPGMTIHAAAVANLLAGDALRKLPVGVWAVLVIALATLAALATAVLAPLRAVPVLLGMLLAWTVAATMAFQHGWLLPWLPGMVATLAAFPALMAMRFAVVDRDRRRIRAMFGLYLPATIIDEMAAAGAMPSLGGEERDISVLFADIAGYTKISEGMRPDALVRLLNGYFTVMTALIEEHGGFVDKFIGDAILAVFGAPYCRNNHARAAVDAALAMQAALAARPDLLDPGTGVAGAIRIGVASGPALIGNIGSPQRLNYTVMGDTVNLASRLEGANKYFGTRVLVADRTTALVDEPAMFREVDRIAVVGRGEPVTVYEPLSSGRLVDPADIAARAAYVDALALWRSGRFADAAAAFERLSQHDPVAAAMRTHALRRLAAPPPDWAGVTILEEK